MGRKSRSSRFASTAPRRRWTHWLHTTSTNVFLRYDYFYIALSSVVFLSKQKNGVMYENKKKWNHIKTQSQSFQFFTVTIAMHYKNKVGAAWTKLLKQSYSGEGRRRLINLTSSLSPSRRLILGSDTTHLPLPHLSNSQVTHFIFIFNTNFDLSRHPFRIPTLHECFMHEKNYAT